MVSKTLEKLIKNPFSKENFFEFLYNTFPSAKMYISGKNLPIEEKFQDKILNAEIIGEYVSEGYSLDFIAVEVQSSERQRKYHRDFIVRYLESELKDGALVAFYSENSENWRFSFVSVDYEEDDGKTKKKLTNFRRFSFLVGEEVLKKTVVKQLGKLASLKNPSFDDLREIFSVEPLSKEFFEGYMKRFFDLWRLMYEQVKSKKFEEKTPLRFSKEAAHQLLNRLTFLYFVQEKKEWFETGGKKLLDLLVEEYKKFVKENPEKRNSFYSCGWRSCKF